MTTAASLSDRGREVSCDKCGHSLIRPDFSETFGEERLIIKFWCCMTCGSQFETEASMPVNAKSNIDGKVTN